MGRRENDQSERTLKLAVIKRWHRVMAVGLGSLFTYLSWRLIYQSQMDLPYPLELSPLLEALWGALAGLGPFFGLALLQTTHRLVVRARGLEKQGTRSIWDCWARSMLGMLGGLAGGVAWRLLAAAIPLDSSTLAMTGLWAIVYTGAILLPPLAVKRSTRARAPIVPALALLPVIGFSITRWVHIAPDQADIDMSVGLWLRVGLAVGATLITPTPERVKRPKYHATGEQVSLLMQTLMQRKKWLTKSGMLVHLAEELAYSPATVRKLCSGERRPSAEAAKKLLQLGQEAGLDRAWGRTLLETTHHFSDRQIADELDRAF
jgi:hypothetical protein